MAASLGTSPKSGIPAVFKQQCHLVREIIKAEWCSVESGLFPLTHFSVNGGTFVKFPNFSLEWSSTIVIVKHLYHCDVKP